MTREDAYCERIMLLSGFWDGYDEWLNGYLEREAPLSDIVLNLVDCGSDMKEVEHRLNLYCLEKPFDEESVHERLHIYLCESLNSGRMDKERVLATMGSFARILPFNSDFARNCFILYDYYDLVTEKIIDADRFDKAFRAFLEKGKRVDADELWQQNERSSSKIFKIFKLKHKR